MTEVSEETEYKCSACQSIVKENSKVCHNCGETFDEDEQIDVEVESKSKKPWYKQWWVTWILLLLLFRQVPGIIERNVGGNQSELGIGVTRSALQSVFETPEIGFSFKQASASKSPATYVGTSPNKLAFLWLIGPEEGLESATIGIGVPADKPDIVLKNSEYLITFLKLISPDLVQGRQKAQEWLFGNLREATSKGIVEEIHGKLVLTWMADKGMVTLKISQAKQR